MSTALVDLLTERREPIIDRFVACLKQSDLPSDNMPRSDLINCLPLFLEELTRSLNGGGGSQFLEGLRTAREHGEQRWEHGFDLSAIVREYGILRRCMLEEVEAASLVISTKEFDQLANCINVGIGEAVKEFTRLEAKRRDELSMNVKESDADTRDHALHDFVENLSDLAWSARPDGYIDFYNRRWYEYTGTTFDEMKGWGWEKVHEGTRLPEIVARWKLSLSTLEPFEMEFRLRSAAGDFRWFLTRAHPLRDRDGNTTRWFGTNTDIDARRQAESALQVAKDESDRLGREREEALALLDSLLEQAPVGVGFCDMQLRFVRLNAALAEINGVPKEAHVGKTIDELCPGTSTLTSDNFRRVMESGEIVEKDVCREAPLGLGRTRWWKVTYYPVRSGGRWLGVGAVCEEITRKREIELERAQLLEREQVARRDAERLNRLKDEFLATVSHELRTPLQAMMGWAHILRNENVDREHLRKGLETIERNAKAQSQLIDDILDVSGIIAGKVRIRADAFDVANVIEAALETVRPASRAKGVEVVSNLPLDIGSIVGDADRLQQVVWNLLSNAVKFTPRGGRVTIGVHRSDSQLAITVSDTGKGISDEFLPSVFERFRQADSGSNRNFGGLGLGLAIVRHLVELHGGTVEASSAGEGKGSTFVVQLPIRATGVTREESESRRPSETPPRRVLDGIRVLVVDDEADARELLLLILKQYGAEAVQASSAHEALAQLQQGTFDVLVSDIGMPGEDGYVLIRQVRALEDIMRSGIPALALTAYARVEDRRRALGAGFQMHIAKPMDPNSVVAAIVQLAERGSPALSSPAL